MNNSASNVASPKECNDMLSGGLTRTYASLIDFEFKHATLLGLFLGWILTAERAQRLFASSLEIRIAGTTAILMYTLLHAVWVFRFLQRSTALRRQLDQIVYMPLDYFEPDTISRRQAVIFCFAHLLFCSVILYLVWYMPELQVK